VYPVSTLVAALLSIVIATTIAANSMWARNAVYSDFSRSALNGLIVGSGLRPYHVGLVKADTQARLLAGGYIVASGSSPGATADLIE
jgi:hypothetical protein